MTLSTCCETETAATDAGGIPARLTGGVRAGYRRLARWNRLRHERHQLGELSDDLLRDIGLTRREALREARRPFWDVTGGRR
ncbi:DUF1127 domain-containing protein [Halomonas sp. C05BenzN]|uniref:DUF1127 domain-containing protein n=1 Tax=Halomonas sp. C05BenzN TaxID=3411041 RepID=UPI003B92B017